jgi:hypothetical protein
MGFLEITTVDSGAPLNVAIMSVPTICNFFSAELCRNNSWPAARTDAWVKRSSSDLEKSCVGIGDQRENVINGTMEKNT